MRNRKEREATLYYLHKLLKHAMSSTQENHLCDWFDDVSEYLIGINVKPIWAGRRYSFMLENEKETTLPRNIRTIQRLIEDYYSQKAKTQPAIPHSLTADVLCEAFHLTEKYRPLMTCWYYVNESPELEKMLDVHSTHIYHSMFAGMLGLTNEKYQSLISPNSELAQKGLLSIVWNNRIAPAPKLAAMFCARVKSLKRVKDAFMDNPIKASLSRKNYSYMNKEYETIKRILFGAINAKAHGVNILIYGEPGIGKTEMVKTLCYDLKLSLYSVSDNESEQSGSERRSRLAASCALLKEGDQCVLLVDESEEVFGRCFSWGRFMPTHKENQSKLFMNRLLERTPVPIIWICNSIDEIDKVYRRRFSYSLMMKKPDTEVQHHIWHVNARKNKIKMTKDEINHLTRQYDVAPFLIETAVKTAALANDKLLITETLDTLQSMIFEKPKTPCKNSLCASLFSVDLINSDVDLNKLTERLILLGKRSFTLCLYGVSGSGKSAYARHLAEKLNMKPLLKRASDFLGPYVGMTEHNIAKAFQQAQQENALLIIDEADSFLRDRRLAHNSWEISSVNEMLTQMEAHSLPFVCTTNLMNELDQASLRRFTFKVRYDYLTFEQRKTAFQHFFNKKCEQSPRFPEYLTPGDFAVVAQKAEIMGTDSTQELIKLLQAESEVRESKQSFIGFDTSR